MIQSIQIKNFKALHGLDITFTPFTVLIGDNSVGKTSWHFSQLSEKHGAYHIEKDNFF